MLDTLNGYKKLKAIVDLDELKKDHLDAFGHRNSSKFDEHGTKGIEVASLHAFTQAIGYVKYKLKDKFNIMYRGERRIYGNLLPTIYRACPSVKLISDRNQRINTFLKDPSSLFLRGTPDYAHEAILQHYGMKTRWIDLVDNHWIALWFGIHRFFSSRTNMELHCETRNRINDPDGDYVYILLVATPRFSSSDDSPGLYEDSDSMLIDLRSCAPSLYLRPHSQHGYLMRRRSNHSNKDTDLGNRVAATIRIKIDLAKEWLGGGLLVTSHALFPPPYYDEGYSVLLKARPNYTPELGTIANFSGSN